MKIPVYFIHLVMLISLTLACGSGNIENTVNDEEAVSSEFKEYWMKGEAELCSYRLEQARYGEIHKGHAVLVFVTEDFSKSKQVKLDDPSAHPADAVKVLKMNMTKKFTTGVYPYSMMCSVFSPIMGGEDRNALKVTTTSQEWCGHTFTQLNHTGKGYKGQLYSYFESEGDRSFNLDEVMLEDEVWTWIRIRPEQLPVGKVKMARGTFAARLRHVPVKVEEVDVKLEKNEMESTYTIYYPSDDRRLSIRFENKFPHQILSWTETYVSGWGESAQKLTTTAQKLNSLKLDYWRKNHLSDSIYRKQLGLDQ